MIYGYARVSTAKQKEYGNSLEDQRRRLTESGAQVVYEEQFTGTKMDRPQFSVLVEKLTAGDTLVVTKLDRISRTAEEGGLLIKELMKRGVKVNILNMGVAENTPMGMMMLHMLLAFAEFERDMIVERTQAGKEVARQREGYKEGRPKLELDEAVVADAKARVSRGEITVTDVCSELGIGRTSWYKYVA